MNLEDVSIMLRKKVDVMPVVAFAQNNITMYLQAKIIQFLGFVAFDTSLRLIP